MNQPGKRIPSGALAGTTAELTVNDELTRHRVLLVVAFTMFVIASVQSACSVFIVETGCGSVSH
jgi:hypothetical protein